MTPSILNYMAVNYYYLFKNISKVNLIIRGPATALDCSVLDWLLAALCCLCSHQKLVTFLPSALTRLLWLELLLGNWVRDEWQEREREGLIENVRLFLLHYELSEWFKIAGQFSHLQFPVFTPLAQTFPGILPQMVIPENIAPNEDKLVLLISL